MRVTYHKLVRDRIPAIIAADGGQPVTRVLDHAGYEAALRAKLLEEAHEAQAAPDGQLASELADVLEVLQALAAVHDMGWEDVVSEANRKRADAAASTTGSSSNMSTKLSNMKGRRLCIGRQLWQNRPKRLASRFRQPP
jgi:predicted house-cleaning noncanonical NTP pyrophosphatase (MazG superfamily)